jgi:hypothetical protein
MVGCFSNLGLYQFVMEPTHCSHSGKNNILDLILSNDPLGVIINQYSDPLSTSDHITIDFSIVLPYCDIDACNTENLHVPTDIPAPSKIYDWASADFASINAFLSQVDWSHLFSYYFTPDDLWAQFKNIIWPVIDLFVPIKLIHQKNKIKRKHYPKHINKLLNRKAAIWRSLKNHKTPEMNLKYSNIANQCRLEIFKFEKEKEIKILQSNNLGAFYNFVNKKLSSKSGVAPLKDPHGNLILSDIQKANLLNEYFHSVYTKDNGHLPPFPLRLPPNCEGLDNIDISPEIVQRIMSKLKKNSAAGPDNLPPIFFCSTSHSLSFPLATIFRSLIETKDLPSEWKHSIITPKFKKGNPSDVRNYRPIALTCVCSKMFESIIAGDVLAYLTEHNLISKSQHAFLKKHSTTTNLLESVHDWTLSVSNKKAVTIAYIDFCRAFDSISHPKLIHKLSSYGITGNLLFWIQAFLTNRTQVVKISSHMSTYISVTSGVPQGSVLGPLLFLLFINDLTDSTLPNVHVKLFADDLKLYTELSYSSAHTNFQSQLNLIHLWATTWQLEISYEKCNILNLHDKLPQTFSFNTTQIRTADSVNDLGVLIAPSLKFNNHIDSIILKAKQRASIIHRSFLSKDKTILTRAFTTYVRPLLEYASPVWSPCHLTLISAIESVQRNFTKRLSGLQNLNYSERLKLLTLKSLEHRRLIIDLQTCHKIIHQNILITSENFLKLSTTQNLRGHSFKLTLPLAKNTIQRHFFTTRIVKAWNSLPDKLVTITNPNTFKRALNKHDLSKFLVGPTFL